ncbi:MAG: DUF2973 domain-containing protein [Elainellaceae cyanobacterium]
MLHLIYVLAFTVLAFLAVGNLIRSLMTLGIESQRSYGSASRFSPQAPDDQSSQQMSSKNSVPHPELLDNAGNILREPYLVMKSITVDDAREQLDSIYRSSPGSSDGSSVGDEESL